MARLYNVFILVFILAVLIAYTAFASHNTAVVEFDYYFGTMRTPLYLLLTGTLVIGALLSMLAVSGPMMCLKVKLSRMTKKAKAAF
ncbi:MAG: LapA family protein [Gammaproteobacteria bacterium]|nr:LapA family protein [Gammaproteobacteria bacterium]